MKMKNTKILAIMFSVLFLLASCNVMSDEGDTSISVNLPPIVSQSRAISGERLDALKTATARYRVTVNGMEREGTDSNYKFTLPVGIVARITVECLNSSGQVIVRAYKEHTVTGGDNNVSIVLKNDGDEIINTGLYYSYGDAAAGGAVTGLPSGRQIEVGGKFIVDDGSAMTWEHAGTGSGSGFTGWKTNVALKGDTDSGTSDVSAGGDVQLGGTYIMPGGNVTLTAQWQKNQYTITYNLATPANATVNPNSINNVTQDALTQVTLAAAPTVNNPVIVGSEQKNYTFLHWKDISDGNKTYNAGAQITLTKHMSLEAVWSDKAVYTVTYSIGSGGPATAQNMPSAPQSVEASDGGTAVVTLPALTATGYNFNGWQISGDSSGNKTGSYTLTESVTATAQWSVIPYSITYNADGGNVNTSAGATEFDVTTGSINLPQADGKTGYTFSHWSVNNTNVTGMTGVQLAELVPSGSTTLTLYAVWQGELKSVPEVGDIIMKDGTLKKSTDTNITTADAIAVVYKVDTANNKAYAVGKNLKASIKWATSDAKGYQKITPLLQTAYTDGRTGLERLSNAVDDASGVNLATNYPAWDYACNYGTNPDTNAGIPSEMQSDWYFLTIAELRVIYNAKDIIDASLSKINGDAFGTGIYWSSTQSDVTDTAANPLNFDNSQALTFSKDSGSVRVCAVRQFTY